MAIFWEQWHPLGLGIVVSATYLLIPATRQYVFPDTLPNLLAAVITVAGVAIGFLATSKSILVSIDDKPIIQRIRDGGLYPRIVGYIKAATFWSFLLTIASVLALLVDYRGLTAWDWPHAIGAAFWLGIAVATMAAHYRAVGIWYTILANIGTQHPR